MKWIYLAPHLDDVALSCGGLIWEQSRAGYQVEIWTICAGDPPPGPLSPYAEGFHARWQTDEAATTLRRAEDRQAATILGAVAHHFTFPDCIYRFTESHNSPENRVFLYISDADLFGDIHPADVKIINEIAEELTKNLPAEAMLVCPLALGNHVDHQVVRTALERIRQPNWYYADYPYVLNQANRLAELVRMAWQCQLFPISLSGLGAWIEAISAYTSQLSTFWNDIDEMHQAILNYYHQYGGICLWHNPTL